MGDSYIRHSSYSQLDINQVELDPDLDLEFENFKQLNMKKETKKIDL
jgi:hypothetical protein